MKIPDFPTLATLTEAATGLLNGTVEPDVYAEAVARFVRNPENLVFGAMRLREHAARVEDGPVRRVLLATYHTTILVMVDAGIGGRAR